MTTDKSWITLRNRRDPVFLNGLQSFMEFAMNHLDSEGKMYCPCKKCVNYFRHEPITVKFHVIQHGFIPSYVVWVHHGEPCPQSSVVDSLLNLSKQTSTSETEPELFDAIHDMMGEHDVHEEGNVEDRTPTPNAEFDDLFAELNTDLFPDCTWMSSLSFLARLMQIKVLNKWTNTSFNHLVALLREAFPKNNHVPESYDEAKMKLRKIGLGYQSIDACVNDCALFWKENELEEKCPVCGESRYVDSKKKGKKVPRKRLRYFPITPRLRRIYACGVTAKDMVWHHTGRSVDGMMRHPVDGKQWQEFNEMYPDFSEEPRNVRLGLAADGFNPFGNMSQSYSMWPVVLTNYNLPPWLCMKESSCMLALLIPGPKSPGKDIDVFLRPLVEELKTLWLEGVRTRDASTNTVFTMRAALLWTINDYPARSYLSGWSGQGYKACPTCNEDTPSRRVLGKTAYVGHRRFLPTNHRFRKSKMFDGKKEKRDPPRNFSNVEILEQLSVLPDRVPGKHPQHGGVKRKRGKSELNWSKRSIFYELDYWSSLKLKHNLDVMHIEKNVCESVLGTLLMNEKSKDTHKARKDLQKMGIRDHLWLKEVNNKTIAPEAPYSFKAEDRVRFCNFINGVRLPDGFGSNFKSKVHGSKISGLKSHDYHIMMQRLLPIGVRIGLDEQVSKTIIDLCTFFKKICARAVDVADMEKAHNELVMILCHLELIYPPAFFDIMVHVVLHLPEEAILGGPVYMRWMYPFERYMKKLKAYVRNKARPEGSIAEGFVCEEALAFCSMYLAGIPTKSNRPERNADDGIPERQYHVFKSQAKTMFAKKPISLSTESTTSLQWFVLDNCHELSGYLSEFKSSFPGSKVETEFASWLTCKINKSSGCSDELKALAHGPLYANSYTGCIVNGVRFVANCRDTERTTQNSGLVSIGEDGTPFYGVLEEIIELNYLSNYSVVLFRGKWYKTSGNRRLINEDNLVIIDTSSEMYPKAKWYDCRQYILATQAKQVFYLQDPTRADKWKVVEDVHHRKLWDYPTTGVVNEIDVLHDNQSSDYNLAVNNDLYPVMVDNEDMVDDSNVNPSNVDDDDEDEVEEDEVGNATDYETDNDVDLVIRHDSTTDDDSD